MHNYCTSSASASLNTSLFCFKKLLVTWISRFLWKQSSRNLWSSWWLLHDYDTGIKTFFFVWILNASVYLIHCCWHEFQDFCGNKHHVDASCLDDVIKTRIFLFIWMLIASFYLINFCWPEFLCFCVSSHVIYKPTIMRMLIVY